MKLPGTPPRTLTSKQVCTRLGRSKQAMNQSKIFDLLDYWQVGTSRLYDAESVGRVEYWLYIREGLIALGKVHPKSPVLPSGETVEIKVNHLNAWFEEDPLGVECPQCGGNAVRAEDDGPVWCGACDKIF